MSASHPSIDCDGGTGSQVIDDLRDNPFPDALYPAGVGGIIGMVGGLRLERWAPSRQNAGRHQIGIGGRLTSESAASGAFLSIAELDGLVSHFGHPRREGGLGVTGRKPGEGTVALRAAAARRYLEHQIDILSHGLWPTLEMVAAGRAAATAFLERLTERTPRPKPKETFRRALDAGQEAALVSALLAMARKADASGNQAVRFATDRTLLWFDWLLELGLRSGEMLGVRLRDVDLDAGTLAIVRRPDAQDDPRRDLARVKGQGRRLDISPYLAARTREHVASMRAAQPATARHDFLFVAWGGAPLSTSAAGRTFTILRRACPTLRDDFCNHVMRHTWNGRFGADALAAGLTEDEEMAARTYAQGWRDQASSIPYLAHRTRRDAASVSGRAQARMMAIRRAPPV